MHIQDWTIRVLKDPLFLQIAPLFVVVLVPVLGFLVASQLRHISPSRVVSGANRVFAMVLDGLGISLPWLWGNAQSSRESSGSKTKRHRRKSSSAAKTKAGTVVKTRAEQIAQNKAAARESSASEWTSLSFSTTKTCSYHIQAMKTLNMMTLNITQGL